MQTEAARGEWFVGTHTVARARVARSRPGTESGRKALVAVCALGLLGAGVLATAIALLPFIYTPLF
jgi:hypothetical protein